MSTIVTRSGKGSPLTNAEVDSNFENLNTDKAELSGATFSGNLSLGDNVKLQLGNQTDGDLQIYHNSFASIIKDSGVGDLYIGSDNNLLITNSALSEVKAKFTTDGAVDLYHNNVAKLSTTSSGISVTGSVVADGLTVDGTASIKRSGGGTAATIGSQGSTNNPVVLVKTDESGNNVSLGVSASVSYPTFYLQNSQKNYLSIGTNGDISFYNTAGTSQDLFWDSSTSRLGLGTTSVNAKLHVSDATAPTFRLSRTGTGQIWQQAIDSSGRFLLQEAASEGGTTYTRFQIDDTGEATFSGNVTAAGALLTASTQVHMDLQSTGDNRSKIGSKANDMYIGQSSSVGQIIFKNNISSGGHPADSGDTKMVITDSGIDVTGIAKVSSHLQMSGNLDVVGQIGAYDNPNSSWGQMILRASDYVFKNAGSTAHLTLSSSGNVNIPNGSLMVGSTTAPTAYTGYSTLALNGTNGGLIEFQKNGVQQSRIANAGGLELQFSTNNTEAMRISSVQNVNIPNGSLMVGATTAPSYPLQVKKDVNSFVMKVENDGNSAGTSGASYADASDGLWVDTRWNTATNTPFKVTSNSGNTPMMIIKGDGRVGIGKAVPAYILDIEGASPRMWMKDTTASGSHFEIGVDTSAVGLGNRANLPLNFFTNNTIRMTIDSSGNVGIGISNPSDYYTNFNDLVLGNTSGHSGMTIASGTTHDGTIAFADGTSGTAEYKGYIQYNHEVNTLTFGTDHTARMTIASSGAATFSGDVSVPNLSVADDIGHTGDSDTYLSFENNYLGMYAGGNLNLALSASGASIKLGGSGAANTLDDYEEGTWTPNGNWSASTAKYVKVGSLVHISMDLVANGTGGTSQITNLPFSCNNTMGTGIYCSGINWANGYTTPTVAVAGSIIYFRVIGDGLAFTTLAVTPNATVHTSFTYYTTA